MSETGTKKKAPKARKKAAVRKKAVRSHLESKWIKEWRRLGGPELVEEFAFHEGRKWRADFAHLPTRTLIEIEGGAFGGRHTRGSGFKADLDKYLTAHLHGWTVVRIGAHQVTSPIVRAVIGRLRENSAGSRGDSAESRAADGGEDSGAGRIGALEERPAWLSAAGEGAGTGAGAGIPDMGEGAE